jgi:hypothetical protein
MRTKPFNLQKALDGHPVVTRGDRRVKRVVHIPELRAESIRLLVVDLDGEWWQCDESGRCESRYGNGEFDLFLEVKTVKRWARMVRKIGTPLSAPVVFCASYPSRIEAECCEIIGYEILPAYEYEAEE